MVLTGIIGGGVLLVHFHRLSTFSDLHIISGGFEEPDCRVGLDLIALELLMAIILGGRMLAAASLPKADLYSLCLEGAILGRRLRQNDQGAWRHLYACSI